MATPGGILQVVSGDVATPVDLEAKSLGGVYHLGGGRVFVLEFGGDRVFELLWAGGVLTRKRTFEVGSAPRLLAQSDKVVRVVSRDPEQPLTDIDLLTGATTTPAAGGELVADLKWYDGGFQAAWIREAKVGSTDVEAEPYKLHAAPSGLYALHAGKAVLTRVGDGKTTSLTGSATAMAGDVALLLAGSGSLQIVREMEVVASHAVPVGSSDLVVVDGVAVVAAGSTGTLTLVGVSGDRPVATPTVTVPYAAGRLHVGPGVVWVSSPQSGQVARCTWSR